MYQASRQYTHFHDVTILVPSTWSDNSAYLTATWETYDLGNILVDEMNPEWWHNPYTKQTLPCGKPGEYTHLTPKWITDVDFSTYFWGESAKVIVHEWGHLRWGVFDEYPTSTDETFYFDENGRTEPTRCSESVTGVSLDSSKGWTKCNTDPDSGVLPEPTCLFYPSEENNPAKASYLYAQYLEGVVDFCHDDPDKDPNARHNQIANNQQNKQCGHRSSWEVMREHADFAENTPLDDVDTLPLFKVVIARDIRSVLVMDISGSMFVVLDDSSEGTEGGRLFLISDGMENYAPLIKDVIGNISDSGIIIDTLALGDEADPQLATLSAKTGGRSYYYSESSKTTALHDSFTSSFTHREATNTATLVQVSSEVLSVPASGTIEGSVHIDSTVGLETKFHFFMREFSTPNDAVTVELTSPSGDVVINKDSIEYNYERRTKTITIRLKGIAKVGAWVYAIRNADKQDRPVEISVESKAIDMTKGPIQLTSIIDFPIIVETPAKTAVYAELSQGHLPVLYANVVATIERPGSKERCNFTTTRQRWRYSVKIQANNSNAHTAIQTFSQQSGAMATNNTMLFTRSASYTPVGNFDRTDSAGVIQLGDHVVIGKRYLKTDHFPPSRIANLRISSYAVVNEVQLSWTSPGDDLDQGTAAYYDLRMSTSFSELLTDFYSAIKVTDVNLTDGTLLSPLLSGNLQTVTLYIHQASQDYNLSYYLAIIAVDNNGQHAELSNIVSVSATMVALGQTTTATTMMVSYNDIELYFVAAFFIFTIMAVVIRVAVKQRSKKQTKKYV
ncbi:calcium-activated chloride channel regulator 1-like [Saccoglossus kowalevskii]|uniref:Calcium-activated chloride channel regulator 1-like n=1 Tax=Saccoglossus kowalevskii TaxID=10224 RepID=A0ABM0LYV0_SACKO|nr:PREDICTED: calcium-activated chloride channel regulator 1-like [Saccoglossus kowalevskii]